MGAAFRAHSLVAHFSSSVRQAPTDLIGDRQTVVESHKSTRSKVNRAKNNST